MNLQLFMDFFHVLDLVQKENGLTITKLFK